MSQLSALNINKNSKILLVFPHPDDETIFSAGFIQEALKIGAHLKLVIFTKGEASTLKNGVKDSASLAEIRTHEFYKTCEILGFPKKDFSILDFPDKNLKINSAVVEQTLTRLITEFAPDKLLTFEPCGAYGHLDHVFLSQCATKVASKLNKKLIYATVKKDHVHHASSLAMAEAGFKVAPLHPNFIYRLTPAQIIKKFRAIRANNSQFSVSNGDILHFLKNEQLTKEFFFSPKPQS